MLPGIVGSTQAGEAIKLMLGAGEPLIGRLLLFDALRMSFRALTLDKDPACPVCGPSPTITELIDYEAFCGVTPRVEEEPVQLEISPQETKEQLDRKQIVLVDVRERWEWDIGHIAGSRLIPLGTLAAQVDALPKDAEVVLYCHHGARSRQAAQARVGSSPTFGTQQGHSGTAARKRQRPRIFRGLFCATVPLCPCAAVSRR